MFDDEASFEGIFDDLQQFEEDEQAERAEQEGAGNLLCDAKGLAASVGVLRLPCPLLTCLWSEEGTQLRDSSAALFGRCRAPCSTSKRDYAGLAAGYTTVT
jgi:hypothetical protein